MSTRPRIAILDDYQRVAFQFADWSALNERAELTVFQDHLFGQDEIVQRLKPFDAVCVMRERTPLTRAVLEQLPSLKLIVTTAMKNASIDMAAAAERGIPVWGTRSTSHGTVELTWGMILSLTKRIPEETAAVRAGKWQAGLGGDLEGHTLGIVGLGKIGARVAKIAQAFGMNVIAWSQNLTSESAASHGARFVSKEQLFREADIVTVHMILSERSRNLVTAEELAWMKSTAYFINTSRAGLVDTAALLGALEYRKIAGAALDVFDAEPLATDSPLRNTPNLMVTPHIGYVSVDGYRMFYEDIVEDLMAWLDGKSIRVLNGIGT